MSLIPIFRVLIGIFLFSFAFIALKDIRYYFWVKFVSKDHLNPMMLLLVTQLFCWPYLTFAVPVIHETPGQWPLIQSSRQRLMHVTADEIRLTASGFCFTLFCSRLTSPNEPNEWWAHPHQEPWLADYFLLPFPFGFFFADRKCLTLILSVSENGSYVGFPFTKNCQFPRRICWREYRIRIILFVELYSIVVTAFQVSTSYLRLIQTLISFQKERL